MFPAYFAASGGAILVAFVVLMFLVIAFTYYRIRGSAIDAHPSDGLDGAPGSEAPSDAAKGRAPDAEGAFSSHGTG